MVLVFFCKWTKKFISSFDKTLWVHLRFAKLNESFFFKICETPEQSFPYLLSAIEIIQEAEQKSDWVDYKQNTKIITDKVLYDLFLKDYSILKNYIRYSITNTFVNPLICTLHNNDDSKISKIRVTRGI